MTGLKLVGRNTLRVQLPSPAPKFMKPRISFELHEALEYREKNRIFGNIDNNFKKLTASEMFSYLLNEVYTKMAEKIFHQEDAFFSAMESRTKRSS